LTPDLWGYEVGDDGQLGLQGFRLASLVEQFGSPLHVVSLPWLRKTHAAFLAPFASQYARVRLATSYKTNPVPAVLRALHDQGTYAEVISEFELWLAERVGLPGERIIVNGPGKTSRMLVRAVEIGARSINVDTPSEIETIAAAADRIGRKQFVGVRVVTSVGWSSQFGLPIATGDALAAFERIVKHRSLIPAALHLHIGTGLKDVAAYGRAIREVLEFSALLRSRLGINVDLYDLGGGFGVPTVRGYDSWDDEMVASGEPALEAFPPDCPTPADYASMVLGVFRQLLPAGASPEIVFEPGRAITSSAQTLVLRVLAVKETGGTRKLILDGGKNITLPLGWEVHKIFPATGFARAFDTKCDLYGPLCHPGDIVAQNLTLPRLEPGELLAVMDAGAYFIPNQMNFSNPRPAIVAVDSNGVSLVRRRESYEDIVRLDEFDSSADGG
jgi:diaminopimelate decarboxylase